MPPPPSPSARASRRRSTIGDRDEVVGFALYNGMKAIALWRAVMQTTGSENGCWLATHVPGVPTGGRAASSLTGAS